MPIPNQTVARNALTAIMLYELSRLDSLPISTQAAIASELMANLQTLRMSSAYADESFHSSQASYYAAEKRRALDRRNQSTNQIGFAVASIMHCIFKSYEVEGFQNELINTTLNWIRKVVADAQLQS